VRIRVLGAHGGSSPGHRQTSFLLNGAVCLDAGAVTQALSLDEQDRVRAILVTHSHLDHVASLPFLVENVFGRARPPIEVAAPAEVIASLRRHLFNDDVWPDFSRLPDRHVPTVSFRTFAWNTPEPVNGFTVTAIPVSHVVPTSGYLVSDGSGTVVFSGDTGPTEAIWAAARRLKDVRAVFAECTFPDGMREIAEISQHLTPTTLKAELPKMPPDVPVLLYHMKPPRLAALLREVAALGEPRLRILADGDEFSF
jgi:ribonuclease BN (tRNA processing enzyme)